MRGVNTFMVTTELGVLVIAALAVILSLTVARQIFVHERQQRRDLGLPPRASLWQRVTSACRVPSSAQIQQIKLVGYAMALMFLAVGSWDLWQVLFPWTWTLGHLLMAVVWLAFALGFHFVLMLRDRAVRSLSTSNEAEVRRAH